MARRGCRGRASRGGANHSIAVGSALRRAFRDAIVEVAGAVRPVGLGRELVDGGCIDGVLALLGALPVTVLAAPSAEEVALKPFPVRAAPASAFCGKCRPSSTTTGGPTIQTRLARLSRRPAILAGHWFSAPSLATGRPIVGETVGLKDVGREGAAQLGAHTTETCHSGIHPTRWCRHAELHGRCRSAWRGDLNSVDIDKTVVKPA